MQHLSYIASMIETSAENSSAREVERRIGDVYGSLSPQLKRAAKYLADHPDDVAVHSMRHIARAAEVQPSTMTRLAQALSFDGYEALRNEYRNRVTQEGGFAGRASRLQTERVSGGTGGGHLQRQVDAAVTNVRSCLSSISEDQLLHAADLLGSCDRVLVTGMLSSFSLAAYAQYVANMALPGWSLIGSTGHSFADRLTELSADDGVLVVSYAPYARISIEAAFTARELGCRVVAVTDSSLSPVADAADTMLISGTQAQHYFPSGAAVVTVLEALIGAIVAAAGDNAVHRLTRVEQTRRDFGEYWE